MSRYKGTPRRVRVHRVCWSDIQEQQVDRNLSNRGLAELLGVRPPYVSRLNDEAHSTPERSVFLTRQQVLRLRHAGFAFQTHDTTPPQNALSQMWQTLFMIPKRTADPQGLAAALARYPWAKLMTEIDANTEEVTYLREFSNVLVSLRRQVGIEDWTIVARSIGLGVVQALEGQKPSSNVRELVLHLLERDLRHPLVLFPSSWEHSVIAGESVFAGLQALAARSHIEGRGCPVRVALDAWPGYVPLWAARHELHQHGIAILFIEDSATKMRLLAEGQVDVIGTTPGGIILRSSNSNPKLPDLRLLAILNRSNGADLVLHRKPRHPIRNPAQKPRAAYCSGSTSELLFRAFSQHRSFESGIAAVPMQGYLPAAQALLRDHLVQYVSIWEPYGTLLHDIDPSLQVVVSTSHKDFDLVADYLVSVRERTGRPLLQAIAVLLRVWDRVIDRQEYLDHAFLDQFSRDCAVSIEACKRMLSLVSFFTTQQMAWRFRHQTFAKQFKNIARVADEPTCATEMRWEDLLGPAPEWLAARF